MTQPQQGGTRDAAASALSQRAPGSGVFGPPPTAPPSGPLPALPGAPAQNGIRPRTRQLPQMRLEIPKFPMPPRTARGGYTQQQHQHQQQKHQLQQQHHHHHQQKQQQQQRSNGSVQKAQKLLGTDAFYVERERKRAAAASTGKAAAKTLAKTVSGNTTAIQQQLRYAGSAGKAQRVLGVGAAASSTSSTSTSTSSVWPPGPWNSKQCQNQKQKQQRHPGADAWPAYYRRQCPRWEQRARRLPYEPRDMGAAGAPPASAYPRHLRRDPRGPPSNEDLGGRRCSVM